LKNHSIILKYKTFRFKICFPIFLILNTFELLTQRKSLRIFFIFVILAHDIWQQTSGIIFNVSF
jgi:hypothetical protein